jgi:hypothetical protein
MITKLIKLLAFFAIAGLIFCSSPTASKVMIDAMSLKCIPLSRALNPVCIDKNGVLFGVQGSSIYKSIDHGITFSVSKEFPYDDINCLGMFVDSRNQIFITVYPERTMWRGKIKSDSVEWAPVLKYTCSYTSDPSHYLGFWRMSEDTKGNLYAGEYGGNWTDTCAVVHKSNDGGSTWSIIYSGTQRHIHFVCVDTFTNKLYLSIGDGVGRAFLLRSDDEGLTWKTLLNEYCKAQPISFIATAKYRFFGSDCSQGNSVFYTSDDVKFSDALTLKGEQDGIVFAMSEDHRGYIYASTRVELGDSYSMYVSPDDGRSWMTLLSNKGAQFKGITWISDFDSDNYAYYYDSQENLSYRFTLN